MFGSSRARVRAQGDAIVIYSMSPQFGALWLTREGVCSRACSPARRFGGSQPRNWARRVFLSGESDDTRDSTPAPACPYVCILARGAIGAHANADTCLRSRFAAGAPHMDAAVTTTMPDADAAVSAAAPPILSPRPCRSDAGSWLLLCLPSGTAAASQGSAFERTSGVLLFGAAAGIRGRRGGVPEAHMHAFVCVYVSSSVPALLAVLDS